MENSEVNESDEGQGPLLGIAGNGEPLEVHEELEQVGNLTVQEEGVQEEEDVLQAVLISLQNKTTEIEEKLRSLEATFSESVSCSLNREPTFREYVEGCLARLEQGLLQKLSKLEQSMVSCLKR